MIGRRARCVASAVWNARRPVSRRAATGRHSRPPHAARQVPRPRADRARRKRRPAGEDSCRVVGGISSAASRKYVWLATPESIPLYTAQSARYTGLYWPKIAVREFRVDPLAARFSEPQKTAQARQTHRQLFDTPRQSPQSSQNPSKHYVFRRPRPSPRPTPRKPPQPSAKLVYRDVHLFLPINNFSA